MNPMKKNILITGASGFIGSFLVTEAIKRNYRSFAGVRSESIRKYLLDPAIHFLELDFGEDHLLDAALEKYAHQFGRFDFVIHTAGLTKALHNEDFDKVNFENTKRFILSLQRNDLVPDKFVYISSLASFGPAGTDDPITPAKIREPLTAYGKSKLKAEEFLYTIPDFPFLIINPTAVYGPRDRDFFFLLKSISNHLELYIGSDQQQLSFVHVSDLVDAIFLAMESSSLHQNLLVSDLNVYRSKEVNRLIKQNLNKKTISLIVHPTLAEIVATLSEGIGKLRGKVPVLNRERLKEFKAMNWNVDCSELTALGYKPRYDLDEGLKNAIYWYKEHGWMK